MKLVVLGGSGFLGKQICKEASLRNWKVVNLCRSGAAYKTNPFTSSPIVRSAHQKIASNIKSLSFNIFNLKQDETGKLIDLDISNEILNEISDADAVIHSMGTLFSNADYKLLKESPNCEQIRKSVKSFFISDPKSQLYIEKLNRDSAFLLIEMTKMLMPKVKYFGFISSSPQMLPFPFNKFIDSSYYDSKQQVEQYLTNSELPFIPLIFKPGFMYSDEGLTAPLSGILSTMNIVKTQALPLEIARVLPSPPDKPLHISQVAKVMIDAIDKKYNSSQTFSTQDIHSLS